MITKPETKMVLPRRALLCGGVALFGLAGCEAPSAFAGVDRLARDAVKAGQCPGIVLAIGHQGAIVHRFVYGARALVPHREAESWDTRFDMASLTKPTVTALAIMQLVEQNRLSLDQPVSSVLPGFEAGGKGALTIRLLLTHYSGLPPDIDLSQPWQGKEEAVRRVMAMRPATIPGNAFVYSDVNYITLGLVVEKLSGLALDTYVARHILGPMGMTHSGYWPDPALGTLIAPTQYDEKGIMLRGVVHDPTARRMGGVAGHAGLFSDAHDMCLYAQALLDRLAGRASTFPLHRETLEMMTTPQQPSGKTDLRGLGWDIATHYSTPRGDLFSPRSFGHTGFTGTSLWIDPVSDSYVLILTNRVHPSGGHSVVALRRAIATEAARALGIDRTGRVQG